MYTCSQIGNQTWSWTLAQSGIDAFPIKMVTSHMAMLVCQSVTSQQIDMVKFNKIH